MGLGKGTDHVVNFHVYRGASLEQVYSIQKLSSRVTVQKCSSMSSSSSSAMLGKQQTITSSSGEWVSILESSEDSSYSL